MNHSPDLGAIELKPRHGLQQNKSPLSRAVDKPVQQNNKDNDKKTDSKLITLSRIMLSKQTEISNSMGKVVKTYEALALMKYHNKKEAVGVSTFSIMDKAGLIHVNVTLDMEGNFSV